jgi:uncharacterized FlaG/YvyC family protein
MEYGLVPKIDQFADNRSLEIQKIQESNKSAKIGQKDQLKQIQQEAIQSQKEVSEAKKIQSSTSNSKYEVVLTNTNFGYNDSSKDFYVKATRGNIENQYPTEEMMRLKSYLMSLNNAS